MDRRPIAMLRLLAVAADASVLAALWAAAVTLRASVDAPGLPPLPADRVAPLGALLVPLWIGALAATGSYRALRVKSAAERAAGVVRGVGTALLLALLGLYLAHLQLNRTLLLGFAVATVPALILGRWAQARALAALRGRAVPPHRVVVVGAPADAAPLLDRLRTVPDLVVAATVAPRELAAALAGPVDEVLLAGAPDPAALLETARRCDERGLPWSIDANFVGLRTARAELQDLDGWTALTFRPASDREPARLAKQALDRAGAAVALVLTAPLLLSCIALIRATDGGPALFVQERIGRYGQPFRMWKLRTMVTGAEQRLDELRPFNETGGPTFKMRGDPRITPVGRWLRRFSLDELPQLVNVLRGEMSLVGPRPPLAAEVASYEPWQLRRLSVRPGMTGLWQVSGRADLPFDRWVALDLEYVDRWSLWLDLALLFRTLPAVISGTGAR